MNRREKIELLAKNNGMIITIAPANSWVGSAGKGKWAYSEYIPGRGIYEPERGFPSLAELESSIKEKIKMQELSKV